ncbi:MAG TPA: hypothetical protein VL285_23695 [Bryobacteraceae bacterium]|nr:hypothetical protein [Bryobacteraceae bacterium]
MSATSLCPGALPVAAPLEQIPSLRSDFAWTLAGNLIYAACQWGMVVAMARITTPTVVGQFSLGLAIAAPIFLLSNLNLRAVLATDSRAEFDFSDYLRLRLLTTAGALAVSLAVAFAGGYRIETARLIGLVGLCKAVESVSDLYYGLYQLRGRMRRIAISLVFRGVLSLGLLILILWMGGSPEAAVAGMGLVWLAVLLGYDSRETGPRTAGSTAKFRTLQRIGMVSLPLGLTAMLLSFNTNIPRYFLEHGRSERDLGIYSALAVVALAGGAVMNAICQAGMTRLATMYKDGRRDTFLILLAKLTGVGVLMGVLGVAAAAVIGRDLLFRLYKREYAEHSGVLTLLMISAAVNYLGSCFGTAITAMRMFGVQMWIHGGVSVVTLACAWPLIHTWGLAGAAWAAVIASACAALSYGALTYGKLKAWR